MRSLPLALVSIGILYALLAFVVLPQKAFFSGDEGLKLIQVQSLLRKGWSDLTLDYPGRELDPDLRYFPINNPPPLIRDGRVYAVYPVLFPLLSAPLFSRLGYPGLYVIPLLSGLLTLAVTARLARGAGTDGVLSALILGLCTPLLFYSLLFWDHTLGVLLSTCAVLLAAENLETPRTPLILLAGAVIGLSIWARTELYVMALILPPAYFLFGRRRIRATLLLCLGLLVALVPLWLFQFVTYGSFAGPHLGHFATLTETLPVNSNRLAIAYFQLLESHPDHRLAFLFVVPFAAAAIAVASRRFRRNHWLVVAAFGFLLLCSLPNLQQAWSGFPMGGFIAITPFVALASAVLSKHQATRVERLLLAVFGGYVALACLATPVDPGLQWGPRLLLPVYPAATILSLKGLQRIISEHKRPETRTLVGVFLASSVVVSLLFQGCSIRLLHVLKNRDRELIESTARLPTAWVVSDEYGYAQFVAPLFFEKEFFYVRTQDDYRELAQTLLEKGISTYAVATYPMPYRRVVDPLDVGDGFMARRIGDQLFEIETGKQTW